ncbi:MAG: hypothetical protein KatS3mg111_2519 [Pirellulaceae bacterium]|nr:MAG: hypothetical protein KatS3mg111_2519 [Pirellulaceae bacterium]
MRRNLLPTPVGTLITWWSPRGLFRTHLLADDESGAAKRDELGPFDEWDERSERLQHELQQLYTTGTWHWDLAWHDWSAVTTFHRQCLQACFAIPMGATISYGDLARRIHRPRAGRAVGRAMATNRWPLVIPCHRVVGADGKLHGYSGDGGVATKSQLLVRERWLTCQLGFTQSTPAEPDNATAR